MEFDVSKYVDKEVSLEEHRKDDDYYSEHDEEDPLDEEEKLKRLQNMFSCLPKVLIKKVLHGDGTKGDLKTAIKRLQEFQDMESPHDAFKSSAEKPPEPRTFQKKHLNCSKGQTQEAANGATKHGPQNGIPPKVKPKTRGKKASTQGRGRGLQMEQEARVERGGQWEWSDVVAELKRDRDAEYGGHRGRGRGGYRGERRGGPGVGTGRCREYQRESRGQDNSEQRRNLKGQFLSSPQHFGPLADNNVDTLEERGHESPHRMSGNWVQSQGGLKQAQSMPDINQTFDEHRCDETLNEQDTALFERKKLLVSGLDEKTTGDGVLNFIEAMSREEVEDVVMLGNGRALVTMLQDITSK